MGMPSQSVYVDTDMLIYYFDKRSDKGRMARDTIKKVLDHLDNPEIHVRIPQVVLGELLIHFCTRRKAICEPAQMIELLRKLEADYPTSNPTLIRHAQELMRQHIKPNDSMLVAHALLDRTTQWLLTTDQLLTTNLDIKKKMDILGHSFTIDSRFHLG
jgi:predicted nucleic acid-binding protein